MFILITFSIIGYLIGNGNTLKPLYSNAIIALIVYIILFYKSGVNNNRRLYNWGFRPSYLCLFGLLVVNLQFFCDYAFRDINIAIGSHCPWAEIYSDKVFFGGYLLIISFIIGTKITNKPFKNVHISNTTKFNLFPWIICILITFGGFIATIDIASFLSGAIYIGSGASDAKVSISSSFEHLLQTFIAITLTLYCLNNIRHEKYTSVKQFINGIPWIFWVVVCGYLAIRFPSGDRGPVMYNLLVLLYSYTIYSGRTIGLKLSAIMMACAIFVVTVMAFIRTSDTNQNFSDKLDNAINRMEGVHQRDNTSFSPFTAELAQSIRCNFIAVRDINNNGTYSKGRFLITAALSNIPGVKIKYLNDLGFKNEDIQSSIYITKSYNEADYYSYGLGSSAFAEAYLEFGLIGLIVTGLFLGFLFKKIDLSFLSPSKLSPCIIISMFALSSISFYISRSSLSQSLGAALYACALYCIVRFFLHAFGLFKFRHSL